MAKNLFHKILGTLSVLFVGILFVGCTFDIMDAYEVKGNPFKVEYTTGVCGTNTQTLWFDENGKKIYSITTDSANITVMNGAYNKDGKLQVLTGTAYAADWKTITDTITYKYYSIDNPRLVPYNEWKNWELMENKYNFSRKNPDRKGNWTELVAKDGQVWMRRNITYFDDNDVKKSETDSVSSLRDHMFAEAQPPHDATMEKLYEIYQMLYVIVPIVFMPLIIVFMVFSLCWLFMFNKTRIWFNNKAGANIVPDSRLNMLEVKAAITLFGFTLFWFPGYLIYHNIKRKRVAEIGAKAAKWEFIYAVFSLYAVIILGTIFLWLAAIVFLAEFFSKTSSITSPYDDSSSKKRCCSNCGRYGECWSNGTLSGIDPSSHCCNDYL